MCINSRAQKLLQMYVFCRLLDLLLSNLGINFTKLPCLS